MSIKHLNSELFVPFSPYWPQRWRWVEHHRWWAWWCRLPPWSGPDSAHHPCFFCQTYQLEADCIERSLPGSPYESTIEPKVQIKINLLQISLRLIWKKHNVACNCMKNCIKRLKGWQSSNTEWKQKKKKAASHFNTNRYWSYMTDRDCTLH